jgi:hypothetical protein
MCWKSKVVFGRFVHSDSCRRRIETGDKRGKEKERWIHNEIGGGTDIDRKCVCERVYVYASEKKMMMETGRYNNYSSYISRVI